MVHPHHTRPPNFDTDRSVLETTVIALGLSALIFVGTLAGLVAATAVGGDPLFELLVTLTVCFATVLLGAAGASRLSRRLVAFADGRRESERRSAGTGESEPECCPEHASRSECRPRAAIAPSDGDPHR